MRPKLMAAIICGGAATHGVTAEAAERLVPNDNYSNAVSIAHSVFGYKTCFLEA